MMKSITIIIVAVAIIAATTEAATNTIICSWHNWQNRLTPANIPAQQCTHIMYTYLQPGFGGTIQFFDPNVLRSLVAFKRTNPTLKVTVAIGGSNAGGYFFRQIAANAAQRAAFVQAVGQLVATYQLDGIDLDWEYPEASDKSNYVQLLRDLRSKLGPAKLLTASVSPDVSLIGTSYDVAALMAPLSFVNLLTLDYYGPYSGATAQNAPLYPSNVTTADRKLSADPTVQAWLKAGAVPEKVLLTLAFYGNTFALFFPNRNGLGAPSVGPGLLGPITLQEGLLSYPETCQQQLEGGFATRLDTQQQSMISSRGLQWMGYDNAETITAKAKYAVQKALAGVMIRYMDYDDVQNVCKGGKMPLLTAVNQVIKH